MTKESGQGCGLKLYLVMSAIAVTWQGTIDSRNTHERLHMMPASLPVGPPVSRSRFIMPGTAFPAKSEGVSLPGAILRGGSTNSVGNACDVTGLDEVERAQQHPTMQDPFLFGSNQAHQFGDGLPSGEQQCHSLHSYASEHNPELDDFVRSVYGDGRGEGSRSTPAASSTTGVEGATEEDDKDIEMFPKRTNGVPCTYEGCSTAPSFGPGNGSRAVRCARHRLAMDVDCSTRHNRCNAPACSVQASYGDIADGVTRFCSRHKAAHHVHLYGKHCRAPVCPRWASYGPPNSSRPEACRLHRREGEIDLRNRHRACMVGGGGQCRRLASYGDSMVAIPLYCTRHKLPGQIDVKNRNLLCRNPHGCVKQASFGELHTGLALYCKQHKEATHINLRCGVCAVEGCRRQAPFVHPEAVSDVHEGRIDRFCSEHKSETCVHLRALRFRHADATSSSSAGASGASMQWEVAMQVQKINRLVRASDRTLRERIRKARRGRGGQTQFRRKQGGGKKLAGATNVSESQLGANAGAATGIPEIASRYQ